jgi:hypothetical protein
MGALLIAATAFCIYGPVLHGNWLWDDDYLISQNRLVRDPYGIWDIWFQPGTLIDYFPLTVSIEWLEWQLWPNDTFPYHFTNVILHGISGLLVWRLLGKLGLRLAWLGGLIFVIHPVQVESVAWMTELKNTLSLPPFLLAMCAWIDYDRRGRLEDYLAALGLFFVAMLCKTSMVMFPVIILLHAWWKRGRVGWLDLKKSAPFFAVSLALGLAVLHFRHFGVGGQPVPLGGFFSRLACAGLSISFYFSKCFLPVDLLPIYPQWNIDPPSLEQFLPWPILAGVIYWLWSRRQPWGRHALFGLGFFLVNLAPFIGFSTISFMRFTWVMDHFLYLPIIGLIGLTVAALGQVDARLSDSTRSFRIGSLTLVLALLTFGSFSYARVFVGLETLWSYTVQRSPEVWLAHNNLGYILAQSGRLPEATEQFEEALRLNPNYAEAHNNLGFIFEHTGRKPEAIDQYKEALRSDPRLMMAKINLARLQSHFQKSAPLPK